MSGAEFLVAIGIAGNVLQFVDFAGKLCGRVREYSSASGIPKKLAAQADRLSNLLEILKTLSMSSEQEALEERFLSRCQTQAQELSILLDSLKSNRLERDRWWKNVSKAIKSLGRAEKIEEMQNVLDSLVNSLSLELQAKTRQVNTYVEANTVSILQRQEDHSSILTDLHPSSIVPIGRNSDFVGRESIIQELEIRLAHKPDIVPKAVLCGLGGVGKSQIALEYAYRKRSVTTDLSVFWVHASNSARFVESYERIASECKIPGRENVDSDILPLVRNWVESRCESYWLMIVDNVDDRAMFLEEINYRGKALYEYLPQSSRGSILYTTRNRDIGIDLAPDRDPIEVPSMNVEEARSLLGEKIRAGSTEGEQLELLDALVFLPLAITQATACMARRRKSVAEYLTFYRQSDSTRTRLLSQRFVHHGRETRPLESVVTTWWISFNCIRREDPRAADLLSIMSFMDPQGIPDALLIREDEEPFDFVESIGVLDAYSLITRNAQGNVSNIHSLVQMATRAWLSEYENKRDEFAAQALDILATKYPEGFYENWPTCALYLPHAEAVLRHDFDNCQDSDLVARANLLLNTSSYLRRQGRLNASELGAEESMRIYQRLYGNEHPDTLASVANFALTIHRCGRYQEAMALQRLVLKGRERVLGIGHRATLDTLNALGFELQSLGRFKEAEEIHRRELNEKKKLLYQDPENILIQADVLIAINNVGRGLTHQGRHAEAESLHQEALKKSEALLGQEHPDTFSTLGLLAGALRDQGKLQEAETMYQRLLRGRKRILGDLHPDMLITLSSIANLRAKQGEYHAAEWLYRQVYHHKEVVLGGKHPSTLNGLHNLGCALFDLKKYQDAENTLRLALQSQEEILGPEHPDTLTTRRNVAVSLRFQKKYQEAEAIDRETLEICQNAGENKIPEELRSLSNIAFGLTDQGQFQEAEEICRQVLNMRVKFSGMEHADSLRSLNDLACILSKEGKLAEAEQLYQQCLDHGSKTLGWEHELTRRNLWNLALMLRDQEKFDEAEGKYRQLVDLQSQILGMDNDETLDSLIQLAYVLQQAEKYDQSEDSYRRVLEAQTEVSGKEHPLTLMIMNNLASVLNYQGKNEESETILRQAVTGRSRVFGSEHPLTVKTTYFLAEVLQQRGKHQEAGSIYQELAKAERIPDSPTNEAETLPTNTSNDLYNSSAQGHAVVE